MKKFIYCFLVVIFPVFTIYAQESSLNQGEEKIHSFVQERAYPPGNNFEAWRAELMQKMKEKWNISFADVRLRVIVEKDGSFTNLRIESEEWKPTDEMIKDFSNMLSVKGRWSSARHNDVEVRSNYTIKMVFQQ